MKPIENIITALAEIYPDAQCMLDYSEPFQLMIAGRLSAQCTDKRVNMVTAQLFAVYKDIESLAEASQSDVEAIIRPCGLYRVKARDIIGICKKLVERRGIIPSTIQELMKFPGIGRKTANLIIGDVFHRASYVTDTHCIRISNRLGLSVNTRPERVETDLRKIIPPEDSTALCHRLVLFGRDYCTARSPKCTRCPVIKAIVRDYPDFACNLERK
ncbi:MAG: endonuclease III [Ruminococcus sp.]|jgi:endonuclease-3|nr:endonuclease III [Ruminococcus sp.]